MSEHEKVHEEPSCFLVLSLFVAINLFWGSFEIVFLPVIHSLRGLWCIVVCPAVFLRTPFLFHVKKFSEEESFQDKLETYWVKQIKADLFTVGFLYCESLKWGL